MSSTVVSARQRLTPVSRVQQLENDSALNTPLIPVHRIALGLGGLDTGGVPSTEEAVQTAEEGHDEEADDEDEEETSAEDDDDGQNASLFVSLPHCLAYAYRTFAAAPLVAYGFSCQPLQVSEGRDRATVLL